MKSQHSGQDSDFQLDLVVWIGSFARYLCTDVQALNLMLFSIPHHSEYEIPYISCRGQQRTFIVDKGSTKTVGLEV